MLNVNVQGETFHVMHDIAELAVEPASAGIAAIVFGHSHKPSIEMVGGVLYQSRQRRAQAI